MVTPTTASELGSDSDTKQQKRPTATVAAIQPTETAEAGKIHGSGKGDSNSNRKSNTTQQRQQTFREQQRRRWRQQQPTATAAATANVTVV